MSNIEKHQPQPGMQITTLDDAMRYAQAMAGSGIVPDKFRQNPANILVAQEIAATLHESSWTVMSELAFIGNTPAFSAKFFRSRVRQAGHKLREYFDKETMTARAVIIRHDDPDHEHVAEWDMAKAKAHGLGTKNHWTKNPELMLKNRAVSEVVREACYEVMGGVAYTPDEVQDFAPVRQQAQRQDQQPQQQAPSGQQRLAAQIPQAQAAGRSADDIRADFHAVKEETGAYDAVGQLYTEAQAAGHADLATELNAWAVEYQQLAQTHENHGEKAGEPGQALTPEAVQEALDAEVVNQ